MCFAARTYYQVATAGEPVPRRGPVLLVANHPNSLLDPAVVAVAADRPMRFLARAPLFRHRGIGWMVRGSGSIPVYRRMDDPELMGRNRDTLYAVQEALAAGSAVGIFPEGLSHSAPALAPLKTGAARIALATARLTGGPFPILPVGLTFRGGKERFRSDALVLVGKPIRWGDLVGAGEARGGSEEVAGPEVTGPEVTGPEVAGPEATGMEPMDPEAVRELTRRIHAGLSRVTVNLKRWEDLPLVEMAEAVHQAEYGRNRNPNPVRWLARMRRTAQAVGQAREDGDPRAEALAEGLIEHRRVLESVGLSPPDLHQVPRTSVAIRWTLRNLVFFGVAAPLALLGWLVFLIPWTVLKHAEPRFRLEADRRATYRVLGGSAAFGGWVLLLALGARYGLGWRPAMILLAILPLLGFLTLAIRDRWRGAISDLQRFLILRGRSDLRTRLLVRQRELADEIRRLQRRLEEER
jgi:glycerol-3-phosphate O-acyltransferase / dihydroxyacetone phosphate acyltransferase